MISSLFLKILRRNCHPSRKDFTKTIAFSHRNHEDFPSNYDDFKSSFNGNIEEKDDNLFGEDEQFFKPPIGGHCCLVLQPKFRFRFGIGKIVMGAKKPWLMLEEAVALVRTLPKWTVSQSMMVPMDYGPGGPTFWGKGKIEELRQIAFASAATAIFINVGMLNPIQQSTLYGIFKIPIYDRFTIVMLIFKTYAKTREAKLQINLAEIPYLRMRLEFLTGRHLDSDGVHMKEQMKTLDQGERKRRDVLKLREHTLLKKLATVRVSRDNDRKHRMNPAGNHFARPSIAVLGYTNAGKTSLIGRLTNDARLTPLDRLFATLDTTIHQGKLPSLMPVYYIDTIGFISQLPTDLFASFTATLDDVQHAHQLIHIRDISHPDTAAQKEQVLRTLHDLHLPSSTIARMLEARNKIDKVIDPDEITRLENTEDDNTVNISCTTGRGLQSLLLKVQQKLFQLNGSVVRRLKLPMDSPVIAYLYSEKLPFVNEPFASDCGTFLFVDVMMNDAQFAKFQAKCGIFEKSKCHRC